RRRTARHTRRPVVPHRIVGVGSGRGPAAARRGRVAVALAAPIHQEPLMSRRWSVTLAVVIAAVVATGCSGASDNGIASKSPQQILAAVKAAIAKKQTLHLFGQGTSDGAPVSVDLNLDTARDAASGSIALKGQRLDLVRIGTAVYVKA